MNLYLVKRDGGGSDFMDEFDSFVVAAHASPTGSASSASFSAAFTTRDL